MSVAIHKKNQEIFINFLKAENFTQENNLSGDVKFSNFHKKFTTLFEKTFPLVSKTFSCEQKLNDDWKTIGLKISKKKLFLLDRLKHIDPATYTKSYVKKYKKLYYRLVEASKLMCNSDKINNAENKSKCMWRIINNRKLSKKNNVKKQEIKLNINGSSVTDQQIVANTISDYLKKTCR